jgi:hypothetical protein
VHAPSAEDHPRLHVGARDLAIGALTASAVVHAGLVSEHASEDPLLGAAFAAAAVVSVPVVYALTRPEWRFGRPVAALLFAGLLVAYPVVHFLNGEPVQRLDVMTKAIEAIGLLAVLRADDDEGPSLVPVAVIAGFLLAFLLLSVSGGHAHHDDAHQHGAHDHH